mmetsp:Transcript_22943/g.33865  ORF Transcript_22943/g.33865 Transcript_22943/m.33865 type:complete len:529 (+) Transcript_22943:77-1663(+)
MKKKSIFDWIEEGGPCRPSYSSNDDKDKYNSRSENAPQKDGMKRNVWYSPAKREGVRDIGDYPQPSSLDTEIPSEVSSNSPISPSSQNTTPTRIMFSPSTDSEDPLDLKKSDTNTTDVTTPTTITIEHKVKKKDTSSVSKYKKLFKPIIAIVILLVSGSAAYFFSEFLTIPGLKTQVDRLEEQNNILKNQVNRLEGQIDRLEEEVDELGREIDRLGNETDRLSLINQSLNQTVIEFSVQNDRLNSSLLYYNELNSELNSTVLDLEDSVLTLEETVQDYSRINDDLNQTVLFLKGEVTELDQIIEELAETNSELEFFVDKLANETAELSLLNSELNSTVVEFQAEIVTMAGEIDRLDNLTQNLATMVSFLNETNLAIDQSIDTFVSGVANQIVASRVMAMGSLENFYRQRTSLWDCDFREYFLLEPFVAVDRNAPIGASSFPEVLDYIQAKVFDDLCLDSTKFKVFLVDDIYIDSIDTPSDVSFNEIQRAVGFYTDMAMSYYFESDTIDPTMWAEANFKCENLPPALLI